MNNHKFLAITIIFFLTACASATSVPTPTLTPFPTATMTPTSIPLFDLEGVLFFDYNGSGLHDEDEPTLSNFEVCIKSIDSCAKTDNNGNYIFEKIDIEGTDYSVNIIDPNATNPALALRYINRWKGAVNIPAYEMNGIQVPEQNLNDTVIIPIERSIKVTVGTNNEIGLMQGFLTIPFLKSQVPEPYVWNYFDIIGYRIFDDIGEHTFFNTQEGVILNYDGKYQAMSTSQYTGEIPKQGVSDSHTGLDYFVPIGNFIISAVPTSEVWYLPHTPDDEYRADIWFVDPTNNNNHYSTDYGHLSVQLIRKEQKIYRGQIIGLSGDSGKYSGRFPQLHFHLEKRISTGWHYIDPFRYTVQFPDGLPKDFWGSDVSYWTVDNTPQFSK